MKEGGCSRCMLLHRKHAFVESGGAVGIQQQSSSTTFLPTKTRALYLYPHRCPPSPPPSAASSSSTAGPSVPATGGTRRPRRCTRDTTIHPHPATHTTASVTIISGRITVVHIQSSEMPLSESSLSHQITELDG